MPGLSARQFEGLIEGLREAGIIENGQVVGISGGAEENEKLREIFALKSGNDLRIFHDGMYHVRDVLIDLEHAYDPECIEAAKMGLEALKAKIVKDARNEIFKKMRQEVINPLLNPVLGAVADGFAAEAKSRWVLNEQQIREKIEERKRLDALEQELEQKVAMQELEELLDDEDLGRDDNSNDPQKTPEKPKVSVAPASPPDDEENDDEEELAQELAREIGELCQEAVRDFTVSQMVASASDFAPLPNFEYNKAEILGKLEYKLASKYGEKLAKTVILKLAPRLVPGLSQALVLKDVYDAVKEFEELSGLLENRKAEDATKKQERSKVVATATGGLPDPNDDGNDNGDDDSREDDERVSDVKDEKVKVRVSAKEVITDNPHKAKDYVRDIEEITGRKIPDKQITRLREELQKREFSELETLEGKEHRKVFDNQAFKNKLRQEWERETGQEWPKYEEDILDKKGDIFKEKGDPYDIHHIIQNNHGGPHEWWNILPASIKEHYLIHRSGGVARKIFNAVTKK